MRVNILDESTLKAQCIDFLLAEQGSEPNDYVIINELNFCDGKRRADIIEANGFLHAYEIKSDLDTLSKLEEQIQDYKRSFDTVTVVTTNKHLIGVQKICAKNVGILLVMKEGVRLIRAAKKYKRFSNYHLASLLSATELNQLMKLLKESNSSKMSITDKRLLVAKKMEVSVLRQATINSLKSRYKNRYARFIKNKGKETMCDDIIELTAGSAGADSLSFNMDIASYRYPK